MRKVFSLECLPPNWKVEALGSVVEFIGGSQPPKESFQSAPFEDGVRLVQIRDFRTDKFPTFIPKNLARRHFDETDVMIGRYGPPVFQILRGLSGSYNVALMKASPKPGMSKDYLFHLLQEPRLHHHVVANSERTAGQSGVNLTLLEAIKIPLPPLAEQRRIAEVLDRAEALRAKRRAALAELDSLTQSIFLDMLRQAGRGVATISIEDGMEAIIDYRGKSPTKSTSGVPLVTARVVKGGELLEPNEFIAEEDYDAWMRRGFPKAGDVLFTTEAPLGEVAQLDDRKVALAQRLLILRGKPSLFNARFLMHVLTAQVVRDQINARATGSTVRGIRQRELRKVILPLPAITLQREFARRVTAVEKIKAAQRASLAELDSLFASLQDRAFRGEL